MSESARLKIKEMTVLYMVASEGSTNKELVNSRHQSSASPMMWLFLYRHVFLYFTFYY